MTASPGGPMPGQHLKDDGSIGYDKDPDPPSQQHDATQQAPQQQGPPDNGPGEDMETSDADKPYVYNGADADKIPSNPQDLSGKIRDEAAAQHQAAEAGAGAPSGQYKVRVDVLQSLVNEAKAIADTAAADWSKADTVANATAPTDDPDASLVHVQALRDRGSQLRDKVKQKEQELRSYHDHLKAALDSYNETDDKGWVAFKDFKGKL